MAREDGARSDARNVKVRSGTLAPSVRSVEVFADEDLERATTLAGLMEPRGQLTAVHPTEARQREMFRSMLRIRLLDERLDALAAQGRIAGLESSWGREAVLVGATEALQTQDWIVPSGGEAGAALHRGLPLKLVVAQALGTGNDPCQGHRPPACPGSRALRFVPAPSGPGRQLPQATGIAWAARMQHDPTVVLAFLDAEAVASEDFHSGLNFAAVFRAPVVFVCMSHGKPIACGDEGPRTVATKALAYGMPGMLIDGGDALAVLAATNEAVTRARRGDGPSLIEAVVPAAGNDTAAARDPLARLRRHLLAQGVLDEQEGTRISQALDRELRDALAAQDAAAPLIRASIVENVWSTVPARLKQQLEGHTPIGAFVE